MTIRILVSNNPPEVQIETQDREPIGGVVRAVVDLKPRELPVAILEIVAPTLQVEAQVDLLESLAAYAHRTWARWMQYLFTKGEFFTEDGSFIIKPASVERWKRQMETHYVDLPESEKKSDREEAKKILSLLKLCDGDVKNG